MKAIVKGTVLAMAIAGVVATAHAADDQNASATINHNHNVNENWTLNDTRNVTRNNVTSNTDTDTDTVNDTRNVVRNTTRNTNTTNNTSTTDNTANTTSNVRYSSTTTNTSRSNVDYSDVDHTRDVSVNETSNISADERKEKNNHGVDVNLEKDLRLSSDINFSGDPEITGDIDLDSAAIAVIDNRQSISANEASNEMLDNTASISDDVASGASGNLGFNVAAGDNNAQDNAASLSAADASFSFGMADAEVFVHQAVGGNTTLNEGVTNAAGLGGNAFSGASGNIGVNVASGNNNAQKNALAASVATAAMAQSSISSNQVSSGNSVSNAGYVQRFSDTTEVSLRGRVAGATLAFGAGTYEGTGNAYQQDNYYLDSWDGALPHTSGDSTGHIDLDNEIQNATDNPYRDGVGGIAFDTDEEGTSQFVELGVADLYASLSGTVRTSRWVAVNATNTAGLSGSAFSNASGNIGVNVASGTGNLQANSLALAVAQPSTGGGTPGGGGGE
ncbi:adhesin [Stenotrophomonas sp. Sa5BUN4]|uniref:Adhesin n=1 Tax=Stenotrophomonas lacuserhaii TaxID=2760084 RepID=A0A8X8K018_9GAMM|nr:MULTISPECIES: adhesin [Stenotrophomonas]MBD7954158.1 adhesin [Stenotrophomonas pennii]MDY1033241.1 adhesin [Stenotrophomonas sp. CFBP8980]